MDKDSGRWLWIQQQVIETQYIFILFLEFLGLFFFFQAEDGIRDLVRSRGLGDVYKRQLEQCFREAL